MAQVTRETLRSGIEGLRSAGIPLAHVEETELPLDIISTFDGLKLRHRADAACPYAFTGDVTTFDSAVATLAEIVDTDLAEQAAGADRLSHCPSCLKSFRLDDTDAAVLTAGEHAAQAAQHIADAETSSGWKAHVEAHEALAALDTALADVDETIASQVQATVDTLRDRLEAARATQAADRHGLLLPHVAALATADVDHPLRTALRDLAARELVDAPDGTDADMLAITADQPTLDALSKMADGESLDELLDDPDPSDTSDDANSHRRFNAEARTLADTHTPISDEGTVTLVARRGGDFGPLVTVLGAQQPVVATTENCDVIACDVALAAVLTAAAPDTFETSDASLDSLVVAADLWQPADGFATLAEALEVAALVAS